MSNTRYGQTSWTTQHALSSDHLPIITTIDIRHDYRLNVIIGDFKSHGVEWGYRSTDQNDRLVEKWSETNQLSLVHDAKSFNSKRWQQGYNPDLAFVSYSIAHLAEKDVMDAIPKTQHRPISIKLNAAIRPRKVPFRRQPEES